MSKIKAFVILFALLSAPARGAVTLKVQRNQALVHMEGLKARKGRYFEVLDLYGNRKGVVKVKRAGKKKAIVTLRWGRIAKGWSLEPISRRAAMSQIKNSGKKKRLARLKKKRLRKQRRLARLEREERKRRRARAEKRRLARKKPQASRRLASADASYENEEYLINENQWSNNKGSGNPANEIPSPEDGYLPGSEGGGGGAFSVPLAVGASPEAAIDILKISPKNRAPKSSLSGVGFGGKAFVSIPINDFLTVEPQLGYRKFSVSSRESDDGEDGSLAVDYVTAGADLKLYITEGFWAGARGVLMYPLSYEINTNLKEASFEGPFHGTIGLSMGYDIEAGSAIIPIALHAGLFMPQSKTVSFYSLSLSAGVGFQF